MTTADSCDSDNLWQFGIYGRLYINKHCTEKNKQQTGELHHCQR